MAPSYLIPPLGYAIFWAFFVALLFVLSFPTARDNASYKRKVLLDRIPSRIDATQENVFTSWAFRPTKSFLLRVQNLLWFSTRPVPKGDTTLIHAAINSEVAKTPDTPFIPSLRQVLTKLASKAEDCLLAILGAGPIPSHIAFIMDGNRRYARKNNIPIEKGHKKGFVALIRTVEICFRLNVKCVTVYCFSIENFNRTREEVDGLMKLLGYGLLKVSQPGDVLDRYNARLNIFGRKELLYEFTRVQGEEAERLTQGNGRAILNVCMPYTSSDEITTAVETCVQTAIDADPDTEPNITERDIDAQLMTSRAGCPPLDILLRTGGDKRLSDFLLWQSCDNTQLQFKRTLWPEFGLWDLVPVFLDFQRKVWTRRLNAVSSKESAITP